MKPFDFDDCLNGIDALNRSACGGHNYRHEMRRAGLEDAVSDTAPYPRWALEGRSHPALDSQPVVDAPQRTVRADVPVRLPEVPEAPQGLPGWLIPAVVAASALAVWRGR